MPAFPTLSVLVPNYNHAKCVPACLKSILGQSVKPIEILVLDDASTDNSVEVLQQLAAQNPSVRLVRNEKNLGVMRNLNKGLEMVRGEYVFLQAADDEVLPGLFEKSLGLLAQYPQAGISCTMSRWREIDSGLTWYMGGDMAPRPAYLSPEDLVRLGKRGKFFIPSSSCVFRREALFDVGRMIPELRWHGDWFSCFAAAFRYGLCYVPEPLCQINIYSNSYYHRGRQGAELRQVLRHTVELLNSPAFADVGQRVRDSGGLALFATPMLRVLLSRKEFWRYINGIYLWRTLWRNAQLAAKKVLPAPLARWLLKRFYSAPVNQAA